MKHNMDWIDYLTGALLLGLSAGFAYGATRVLIVAQTCAGDGAPNYSYGDRCTTDFGNVIAGVGLFALAVVALCALIDWMRG